MTALDSGEPVETMGLAEARETVTELRTEVARLTESNRRANDDFTEACERLAQRVAESDEARAALARVDAEVMKWEGSADVKVPLRWVADDVRAAVAGSEPEPAEPDTSEPVPTPPPTVDLLAALQTSIDRAKAARKAD